MMKAGARISGIVVVMLLLTAFPSSAAADDRVEPGKATPVQREQAQASFARGRALFIDKSYDRALVEFAASLDVVASPNTRLYYARTLRALGRNLVAYVELGRTAVEARELAREDPRYLRAADAALADRDELAPMLGLVRVQVSHPADGTDLIVNGESIRRGAWNDAVPVEPGAVNIVLRTPGRADQNVQRRVERGTQTAVAFDAESAPLVAKPANSTGAAPTAAPGAPAESTSLRPFVYVAAGVSVAGLATFAVAGLLANGTYRDLESTCGGGPCPPERAGDVSRGRTQQTVANVGLVVGLVGAVGAGVLFALEPKLAPSTNAAANSSRAFITLPRGGGPPGVGWQCTW